MHYERTERSLAQERAMERFQEAWQEAHEAALSDAENLLDYVQRLDDHGPLTESRIDAARSYMKALGVSLDALERLAR